MFTLTIDGERATLADDLISNGTRVPLGDTDTHKCFWVRAHTESGHETTLGAHVWVSERGEDRHILVSNAAWAPGAPQVKPLRIGDFAYRGQEIGDLPASCFPPRFWTAMRIGIDGQLVERHRDQEFAAPAGHIEYAGLFTGAASPWDGGEQGGSLIWLHPGRANSFTADCLADRNPVAAFHAGSGMPLTRRELGYDDVYLLDRTPVGAWHGGQMRLAPFEQPDEVLNADYWPDTPDVPVLRRWCAFDSFHLVRGFMSDWRAWLNYKDPIVRWRIIMLAHDVLLSFPMRRLSSWNGAPFRQSLALMLSNVREKPGLARLGIARGLAWCIRVMAVALELTGGKYEPFRAWLRAMIETVQLAQAPNGLMTVHDVSDRLDQEEPGVQYGLPDHTTYAVGWQHAFLVRALFHAQEALAEPASHRRVKIALERYYHGLYVDNGHILAPDENHPEILGVPRYVATQPDFKGLMSRGWDTSRAECEADVFACLVRIGVLPKLPARYAAWPYPEELTRDAKAVAEQFGTINP